MRERDRERTRASEPDIAHAMQTSTSERKDKRLDKNLTMRRNFEGKKSYTHQKAEKKLVISNNLGYFDLFTTKLIFSYTC